MSGIINWIGETFDDPKYKTNLQKFKDGFKTDPAFTKKAGRYTAIDAMYQIMHMTALYGPIGEGWKYSVDYKYHDTYVAAEVTLHIYSQDNNEWGSFGPIGAVASLKNAKGEIDKECAKSAMTNALTKAFSHTGLNADVFMGLFDNNSYVEQLKKSATQDHIENAPKV